VTKPIAILCLVVMPGAVWAQNPSPRATADTADVTPAVGPSWLLRRGLFMAEASLGRIGDMGHAESAPAAAANWPWSALQDRWLLNGGDLYRLNCRSCHNAEGTGLPPEINSVLDPVRAASAPLLQRRMEERGRPIDAKTARELAGQAEANLRKRLHDGGEKMPALPHLRASEVEAILAYLGHLAGVPETQRWEARIALTDAQVGQHIVKGTCQICHDAAGSGNYAGRGASGKLIPSLLTIVETRSVLDVIRKVHTGSASRDPARGEMPLFPYLNDQEIGAAYAYLVTRPPRAEPVQ